MTRSSQKKVPLRSACPLSATLDLVGDKWSLLVVRDLLFFGKKRYGDLARSPEKIPTNLLADRLKRLEAAGILEKKAYQQNPTRYEYHLTPRGLDLRELMLAMVQWGQKHLPGVDQSPPPKPPEEPQGYEDLLRRIGRRHHPGFRF